MIQRPPDDEHPQRGPMPTRSAELNSQIGGLLNVLETLQSYLLVTPREIESGISRELDGGVPLAALSTFCKVCSRIDRIVEDDARWSLDAHDRLYEALVKTTEKQRETLQVQQDFVRDSRRPSRTHRPEFTQFGELFIAYWGDLTDQASIVMGKGLTPEEAIADFDQAFLRKAGEQLRFATPEAETIPEPVPESTQKIQKKKKHGKH